MTKKFAQTVYLIFVIRSKLFGTPTTATNFVAINKYLYPENLQGQFFALFVIATAAVEVAVAIAIIISLYRKVKMIDVEKVNEMKY